MKEQEFLQQVYLGTTPSIDEFVDALGDRTIIVDELGNTLATHEFC